MKYKSVIILFFSSLSAAGVAAEKAAPPRYIFSSPILSPSSVVELSEKYLVKEKNIDLDRYILRSVSFGFYSAHGKSEDEQKYAKWYISYQCKPIKNVIAVGCDFGLSVSNSKKPEFQYFGGK